MPLMLKHKIGKIYTGDVVDGGSIGAPYRTGSCRDEQEISRHVAWYALATVHGIKEAVPETAKLWNAMAPKKKVETWKLVNAGLRATFRWENAILSKQSPGGWWEGRVTRIDPQVEFSDRLGVRSSSIA